MKIGYFVNQYPAVSHTFIRREIRALEALGVEIVRYALRSRADGLTDPEGQREHERTAYVLGAGAHVLLCSTARAFLMQPRAALDALRLALKLGWRSDRGLLRHLAYLAEATVLAAWCRRDGIAHLHAHFGTNSAAVAMLAWRFSGISYSFTAHGPEEFEKGGLLSLDEKLRRAAFAVCVSSFGRSQLMRLVPETLWGKIKLVHCGLDAQFLSGAPPAAVEAARFVCIGRLCVEKAQTILVDAAAALSRDGVACEVVLVGDGPMRPAIEAAIDRAGLRGRIRITGWASSERVKQEIAAARALVLPSFAENLPVVIMEAMALGRPAISTYVAGIPELVRPGENGWLVPPSDVEALAGAMREALAAPAAEIAKMGAAGRQRVEERHNAAREAEKLKDLFAQASAAHGAKAESERRI
jgi:glycosyltransferase involved in cell wall biosynthesis